MNTKNKQNTQGIQDTQNMQDKQNTQDTQNTQSSQNALLHGLLALLLTLTIISLAVVFTLAFKPLYYLDMQTLHLSEATGYSDEEIRANYNAVIDYNLSFGDEELEFPTLPMSESGRIHFEEVKDIFNLFKYMAIGGTLLSAAGILWMYRRRENRYLKLGSILSVALPAAVGVCVAANWDQAFILFHKIAFDNDYWLFDPETDPVIRILPDTFFLHCALLILFCIVLGAGICALAYRRSKATK